MTDPKDSGAAAMYRKAYGMSERTPAQRAHELRSRAAALRAEARELDHQAALLILESVRK